MKKINVENKEVKTVKGAYLRKSSNLNIIDRLDVLSESANFKYKVSYQVSLSDEEWSEFMEDTLCDREWIEDGIGGVSKGNIYNVIKVFNEVTGEYILVNPEGYNYPRYIILPDFK